MNRGARLLVCTAGACLAVLGQFGPLFAQEHRPRPFSQDYQAFRFLLHKAGLTPLLDLAALDKESNKTVLILLGNTKRLPSVPNERLKAFVQQGGAVLLATDSRTAPEIERLLGARITGEELRARDLTDGYHFLRECPFVSKADPALPPFAKIDKPIATNCPSTIEAVLSPEGPTLRLPSRDGPRFGPLEDRPSGLFALAFRLRREEPVDAPHVLLLADHSVFINEMMLQNDNGNFQFADATIRWFAGNGTRTRALFLADGEIVKQFEVPLSEIPDPTKLPPPRLPVPPVEVFNQVLASMQNEDVFNRFLLEQFPLHQIVSATALGVTFVLLLYGASRLWRGRYSQDVHP